MKFRRWVVFTFAVHIAVIALDKGAGLILFKILEGQPKVKGATDLLATLPFVIMAVANMGLAASSVFLLRKQRFGVQEVAETNSMVALVWGGAVAVMAVLVSQFVLPLIQPEWDFNLAYVVPICMCVPFLLTTSFFNSIQLAVEKIRDYNLVHLVASLTFLPLFLLFFYGFGSHATVSIAGGRLVSAIIVTFVTLWLVRRIVKWRPRMHWPFLKAGVTYGWRANITSVLTYLNHRVDLYLVGFLYRAPGADPLEEVAFYSLAVTLAELVWHFPEAMRDLFFSKVAGSSHEQARAFTPVLCRLCLWVGAVGAIGIYLLADPLMEFISPEKWDEIWQTKVLNALVVLIPGTVAFVVAKVLQADLAARGHLNPCVRACSMVFVVMVVLDWVWIPTHGALGAAYASSVAYFVSAVYSLFAYRMTGGGTIGACLLMRRSDLSYVRELVSAVIEKVKGWKS